MAGIFLASVPRPPVPTTLLELLDKHRPVWDEQDGRVVCACGLPVVDYVEHLHYVLSRVVLAIPS